MPTSNEIQRLRQSMSDNVLFQHFSQQDAGFRLAVDRVKAANPQMGVLEESKFPSAMLDLYYDVPQEAVHNPATTQMASALGESSVISQPKGFLEPTTMDEAVGMSTPQAMGNFGLNVLKSTGRLAVDVPKGLGKTVLGLGVKAAELIPGVEFNDPFGSETTVETLGKAAVGGMKNTIETLATPVAKIINYVAGSNMDAENIFNDPETEQVASAIGQYFSDRTGVVDLFKSVGSLATGDPSAAKESFDNALGKFSKTAYEDPAGLLSDIMSVIMVGGAALKGVGKLGQMGTALATAGEESVPIGSAAATIGGASSALSSAGSATIDTALALDPAYQVLRAEIATLKAAAKGISHLGRFAMSQMTGLKPETIETLDALPGESQAAKSEGLSRESLSDQLKAAIDKGNESVDDTGKAYSAIRKSSETVNIPRNNIDTLLNEYGVKFDWKEGRLLRTPESIPMEPGDIKALESFLNGNGQYETLTGNGFLNTRKALDNMAKYGEDKTTSSVLLARGLRKLYDSSGKAQLSDLSSLDAKYAAERPFFDSLTDKYLTTITDSSGKAQIVLKPNAGSQLLRASPDEIERLTSLIPKIKESINLIKALEDIEYSAGTKVGTYFRAAVGGGSVATGFVPGVVAALMTEPHIFYNMLTWYAKVANPIKGFVKGITQAVRNGIPLTPEQMKFIGSTLHYIDTIDQR